MYMYKKIYVHVQKNKYFVQDEDVMSELPARIAVMETTIRNLKNKNNSKQNTNSLFGLFLCHLTYPVTMFYKLRYKKIHSLFFFKKNIREG